MGRNSALSSRLREVLLNGKWIANTNCKEQVSGLHWEQATRRVNGLNSIAALTYHMNYYLAGLLDAFETGKLQISDKYSFDVPDISGQEDWDSLVNHFLDNASDFADRVEQMDDEIFDQPFLDEKYGSYLRNIEGIIEHSYYHLGQMSLIRKMITSKS